MKKIFIILAVVTACLQIIGCGRKESNLISFHLAYKEPSPNRFEIITENTKEKLFLEKIPQLTIDDIASAEYLFWKHSRGINESLSIKFTESSKKKLFKVTSENIKQRLGIVIEKKLITAPIIFEPIEKGEISITGKFKEGELKSIAERINQLVGK